jgi:hypothetical protein
MQHPLSSKKTIGLNRNRQQIETENYLVLEYNSSTVVLIVSFAFDIQQM